MATIKEELLVLGIRASGYYLREVAVIIRQVTVMCRRGTSVVKNLKFPTPFFVFLTIKKNNNHYTIYKP